MGIIWTQCGDSARAPFTAFPKRWLFRVFAHGGFIYLYGGNNESDILYDLWKSSDGVVWNRVVEECPAALDEDGSVDHWGIGPNLVSNGTNIIFIPGCPSDEGRINRSVSPHGAAWTTDAAVVGGITRQDDATQIVKHGTSLLLITDTTVFIGGGNSYTGGSVWSSADSGATWTLLNGTPGWAPSPYRGQGRSCSDGTNLWFLSQSDIWKSTDNGTTWTKTFTTSSQSWTARNRVALFYYADLLWICGGETLETNIDLNDIWSSPDGIAWTDRGSIPFTNAGTESRVAMMGGVFVICSGWGYSLYNGTVWRMQYALDPVDPIDPPNNPLSISVNLNPTASVQSGNNYDPHVTGIGGTGTIHYKWYYGTGPGDAVAIVPPDPRITGEDLNHLVVRLCYWEDARSYICKVWDDNDTLWSTAQVLTVTSPVPNPAPNNELRWVTLPASMRVQEGSAASFKAIAFASFANPTYVWYKGTYEAGAATLSGSQFSGATSTTLTITGAAITDAAYYVCKASDGDRTIWSTPAALSVVTNDGVVYTPDPIDEDLPPVNSGPWAVERMLLVIEREGRKKLL